MKICICTTPIRPQPTTYPPFGSMAIIQSLREIGETVDFFNIDYFRPSRQDVEQHFRDNRYDVVGISAVVSTAYAYTKFLAQLIKRVSPATLVIVGGNLAASAEILLRKAGVDFCVVGDGELIIRNLLAVVRDDARDIERLRRIAGVCFLDERGQFEFTGFGPKPAASEIPWPDYGILEADGSLPYFVSAQVDDRFDGYAGPVPSGARLATVVMTKGCVARCTFCHRWEKGFRARPTEQVIDHVRQLMDRYNVRFVDVADENFGSNQELAHELATQLGNLGIKWRCAGVRTSTVSKETLAHWKKNGCISVIYGIESGSPTILEVMEKKITREQNIDAIRWTFEVGLGTVIQLVLGMPGETDKTIAETISFLKEISEYQLFWGERAPSEVISINYAQALPGTPLYEYAREHGYIGKSVDAEEQYLLRISDTDAYAEDHFINYTGLPLLKVLTWRPRILAELDAHYFRQRGTQRLSLLDLAGYYLGLVGDRIRRRLGGRLPMANRQDNASEDTAGVRAGYFNIHANLKFAPLLLNPFTATLFYPLLAVAVAFWRGGNLRRAAWLVADHLWWSLSKPFRSPLALPDRSLRKAVNIGKDASGESSDKMIPLRLGR